MHDTCTRATTAAPQTRPKRLGWPRHDRRPPPHRLQPACYRLGAGGSACCALSRQAHLPLAAADQLGGVGGACAQILPRRDEQGRLRRRWPMHDAVPLGDGCSGDAQGKRPGRRSRRVCACVGTRGRRLEPGGGAHVPWPRCASRAPICRASVGGIVGALGSGPWHERDTRRCLQ